MILESVLLPAGQIEYTGESNITEVFEKIKSVLTELFEDHNVIPALVLKKGEKYELLGDSRRYSMLAKLPKDKPVPVISIDLATVDIKQSVEDLVRQARIIYT